MHPWQGITLIVILAGLAILRRGRGWAVLLAVGAGAALPLAYYWLLSHSDPAWRLASHYEVIGHLPALVLLAGLGPLALLAALGLRRPRGEVIEQLLLLWVAGCLITYFVNDAFAPHALQGISLPLAVLAVRGGQRLHLPWPLGLVAIAALTIPGLAFDARKFVNTARNEKLVQYYLPRDDARALDWISAHAPPGGILAPTPFALDIPPQTGRAVWVGHGYWSRDYFARARRANRLFTGHMRPLRGAGVRQLDRRPAARRRLPPPCRPVGSAGVDDRLHAPLRLRARLRPARRRRRRGRPVGDPVDEPQPRPGGVDGAHLVVDQPAGQSLGADHGLGQVRGHPRRLLRPADPQPARRDPAPPAIGRALTRAAPGARRRRRSRRRPSRR